MTNTILKKVVTAVSLATTLFVGMVAAEVIPMAEPGWRWGRLNCGPWAGICDTRVCEQCCWRGVQDGSYPDNQLNYCLNSCASVANRDCSTVEQ